LVFPLSLAQQRLWLLERLAGANPDGHLSCAFRVKGKLDAGALEAALGALVLRHGALRTGFAERGGELAQVVAPSLPVPLAAADLGGHAEGRRAAELARLVEEGRSAAFDLERGPLLRARLLRLGGEEQVFQLTAHPLICDDRSMALMARELSALYRAFSRGEPPPLPALAAQYGDYAAWQREWLRSGAAEPLLAYWTGRLADAPALELPTDKPRPAAQSFRGQSLRFSLPPALGEGLKALGRGEGASLSVTLLAAFNALLHRYSGQDDIVVGMPAAGRSRPEFEGVFGLFINPLALRTDLSGNPSFRELLARVRDATLAAFDHQDMPFEKLAESLPPQRGLGRNPLFHVWFVAQGADPAELRLDGLAVEPLPAREEAATFDLAVQVEETPRGDEITLAYAADLFEAETIARLAGHFQTLLEGVVARPQARLSELPLLTESERRQLLVDWNETATAFPQDRYLHELFEEQAARSPEAVAVVHEGQPLSYGGLNARANQLAHHLRGIGVGPEALVAICVERSLDMVVGLLGILKAGGAYVPLDPGYPRERLEFILEDSAPVALLTQGRFTALFGEAAASLPVIDLSAERPAWESQPETNPDRNSVGLTPENLANVLYTSGSTGKPKGVGARHRSLQNLLPWYIKEFAIARDDAILVATSHSYDLTQRNLFGPLLAGARLVLAGEPFDPRAVVKLVAKERVSMMNLTPSGFHALIDANADGELGGLRCVVLGGEPVQPSRLQQLPPPRPEFINGYGPTECTGVITCHRMSPDLAQYLNRPVPIGRPIANARVYLLDAHQQPVPIGVAGEIHIGGVPVGRGYLNRPALTAERFVRDPFAPEADARMYKTGDLARWLGDGTIEFLGRNDFQVKIRGYRIELGEIEAALREHPRLREAVASVYEPVPGDKRLAAYLVPQEGNQAPAPAELREFLKPKLPEFMIPSAFVLLDALPLTPNGKLDRKALPKPRPAGPADAHGTPRNETERQLAGLWQSLLGVERVGVEDNFFERGGHSLLAVRVVAEVKRLFDADIALGALYQSPTVAELAKLIDAGHPPPDGYSLVPIQTRGSRPALFAIHTLTFTDLFPYLGQDQPLYFLRYGMAARVADRPVPLPPLAELAAHYVLEMRKAQPQGPYYLMGYSFGGLVAYEMACQLQADGQRVAFLALMDTYLTEERRRLPVRQVIRKLGRQTLGGLRRLVKNKINFLLKARKNNTDFWPHLYMPAADHAARKGYKPKAYPGHVTLFKARDIEESMFYSYCHPEHAWIRLLGDGLEIQEIPGEHLSIFKEPHVRDLVAKLTACMDKALCGN
jgi:aspartate racemase